MRLFFGLFLCLCLLAANEKPAHKCDVKQPSVTQIKEDLVGKKVILEDNRLPFPFQKGHKCEFTVVYEKTSKDGNTKWFAVKMEADAC